MLDVVFCLVGWMNVILCNGLDNVVVGGVDGIKCYVYIFGREGVVCLNILYVYFLFFK